VAVETSKLDLNRLFISLFNVTFSVAEVNSYMASTKRMTVSDKLGRMRCDVAYFKVQFQHFPDPCPRIGPQYEAGVPTTQSEAFGLRRLQKPGLRSEGDLRFVVVFHFLHTNTGKYTVLNNGLMLQERDPVTSWIRKPYSKG
jgi:hypothetical protein